MIFSSDFINFIMKFLMFNRKTHIKIEDFVKIDYNIIRVDLLFLA